MIGTNVIGHSWNIRRHTAVADAASEANGEVREGDDGAYDGGKSMNFGVRVGGLQRKAQKTNPKDAGGHEVLITSRWPRRLSNTSESHLKRASSTWPSADQISRN